MVSASRSPGEDRGGKHQGGRTPSAALTPLVATERILDRERREIRREQEALETFADRIDRIDAGVVDRSSSTLPVAHSTRGSVVTQTSTPPVRRQIRTAYRETVMDVPHYDEVYGESFEESVVAELGPDVARALTSPTAASAPTVVRGVLAKVAEAIDRRDSMLETLASEAASLDAVRGDLRDVADVLSGHSDGVPASDARAIRKTLDDVVTRRQAALRSASLPEHVDAHGLCAYLYGDEAWTYPVLHASASLRSLVDG